jgi:hypothetical protein
MWNNKIHSWIRWAAGDHPTPPLELFSCGLNPRVAKQGLWETSLSGVHLSLSVNIHLACNSLSPPIPDDTPWQLVGNLPTHPLCSSSLHCVVQWDFVTALPAAGNQRNAHYIGSHIVPKTMLFIFPFILISTPVGNANRFFLFVHTPQSSK